MYNKVKDYLLKHRKYIINVFITFGIMFILSFIVFWVVYGLEMRLDYLSNSLFIVNMISLVVSIVMQTGATRLYIGFNYSLKSLLKPVQTKKDYPSMQDYYDEVAPRHKKDVSYVMVANGIFLVAALILSRLYLMSL
jgi:hypothetical protein